MGNLPYKDIRNIYLISDGLKYQIRITMTLRDYPYTDENKYKEYSNGLEALEEYERVYNEWQSYKCKDDILNKEMELLTLKNKCKAFRR